MKSAFQPRIESAEGVDSSSDAYQRHRSSRSHNRRHTLKFWDVVAILIIYVHLNYFSLLVRQHGLRHINVYAYFEGNERVYIKLLCFS